MNYVGCICTSLQLQKAQFQTHEVLTKSLRNWNAARKPLTVQLCAAKCRELYPLWTTLPSGVLLWGGVCFVCAFLWRNVSAVLRSNRPSKMTDVKEQRICIKFCFKLGKTVSETHRILKEEFGDNALGQKKTYECFKRFKNGWISVDNEERSWLPSTGTMRENVAKFWHWKHRA